MPWNEIVRQTHRWVSFAFTLAVIVVITVGLTQEAPAEWVFYLPLIPLALLFLTGLYLFVLPYAAKWRGARRKPE